MSIAITSSRLAKECSAFGRVADEVGGQVCSSGYPGYLVAVLWR